MTELTEGEFLKPFTAWNIPPPIAPMVKAPPQSSTILQGLKAQDSHCVNVQYIVCKCTDMFQYHDPIDLWLQV